MHSGHVNLAFERPLGHAYRGLSSALHMIIEVAYINRNRGNQRAPRVQCAGDLLFRMLCPVDLAPVRTAGQCSALSFFMFANISSIHFIWFYSRDGKPANLLPSSSPPENPAPAAVPRQQRYAATISAMTVLLNVMSFQSPGASNSNRMPSRLAGWRCHKFVTNKFRIPEPGGLGEAAHCQRRGVPGASSTPMQIGRASCRERV